MASYASIDDPSAHFQAQLYTGNGGTQSITNTGNSDLQPDWVWLKRRDGNDNHSLFDSNRGVTKELNTNGNGAEGTASNLITSFDSDGFGLGDNGGVNGNGESYVAWQWKANGGTTSSNSDGDITSTVQANTTAGVSILTFTTEGNTRSVGHGLGGTPDVIITKVRSGAGNWIYQDFTNFAQQHGQLNTTNGFSSINYNAPSSTTFNYNDNNGNTQVAYCFREIRGFSRMGRYKGHGDFTGNYVFCGFRPAWILIKNFDQSEPWVIYDASRDPDNPAKKKLTTNTEEEDNGDSQVGGDTSNLVDFYANGFRLRSNNNATNADDKNFVFMAFAKHPFATSSGIPATAV